MLLQSGGTAGLWVEWREWQRPSPHLHAEPHQPGGVRGQDRVSLQTVLLEKFNFELLAENILFSQNRAFYSV